MLLSPSSSSPIASADSSCHPCGSLFTIFLTAPLQAFCLLLGISGSDIEMVCNGQPCLSSCLVVFVYIQLQRKKMFQDTFNKAEKLLSLSLSEWGLTLATSDTLNPVWAQTLSDPFLRRLLLRYFLVFHKVRSQSSNFQGCTRSEVSLSCLNSQIAMMHAVNFIFKENMYKIFRCK